MADTKLDTALSKLAANKAAALTGALAIAMGIVIGVVVEKDDPQRDTKLEQLGDAIDKGSAETRAEAAAINTAAYNEAVGKVRAEDPSAVDLLSGPVEPGVEVVTGASFPIGARLISDVELVGVATKAFVVLDAKCTDRPAPSDAGTGSTWCEVRARNDGTAVQRLTALVRWEVSNAPP